MFSWAKERQLSAMSLYQRAARYAAILREEKMRDMALRHCLLTMGCVQNLTVLGTEVKLLRNMNRDKALR